jgi:hypothetical protein
VSIWTLALGAVILLGLLVIALPLFRPRETWDPGETSDLDRLFDAKARALRALKDLDHEKEAGLLSAADWARVRTDHLAEAVRLNREIAALTGVDPSAAEEKA